MSVKPIPEGYHSVTPYLVVEGAESAIDFYGRAFGAAEHMRLPMGEKIGHAEIRIGESMVMLTDEFPDMGILGPKSRGGPTSSCLIYVEDVDAVFARAIAEGATEERAPEDQFWGDRMGTLSIRSATAGRSRSTRRTSGEEETLRRMQDWTAKQGG